MTFFLSENTSEKGPLSVRSGIMRAGYPACLDFLVRNLTRLPVNHPLRPLFARGDIEEIYMLFENYGISFKEKSHKIHGVPVRDNRVILRPIKTLDVITGDFIHLGCPYAYDYNNAENLSELSVWGTQNAGEPTYVATKKVACTPAPNGIPLVKLLIDKKKLFERRHIFLDPESLVTHPYEFGTTFMVFGGIPREAIERIDEVPHFAVLSGKSYSVEEFIKKYERKVA